MRTRVERHTRAGAQHEGDRDEHLADDDERLARRERVEGRGDAALDGVLDRHHRGVDVAGPQRREGGVDRAEGQVVAALGGVPRVERHLRERAARTEVAEAVQLVGRAGRRHDASFVRSGRPAGRPGRLVPGSSLVAEASACCSSGVRVMLDRPADDALGIRAGLAAGVDRADDDAVAEVVDDRGGERQPPTHVAERVVAHDRDVAQALAHVVLGARHVLAQAGQLGREPVDAVVLGGGHARDVGLAVVAEGGEVAADPGEPQLGPDGEREGEQRDDDGGDGQGRQRRGVHDRQG